MESQRLLTLQISSALGCALLALFSLHSLIAINRATTAEALSKDSEREVLYLPNGDALHAVSLGFDNVAADILWFKTVDYFGRHYSTDRDYRWLGHMCDIVTSLNPRTPYVYQFCSNMLSWECSSPTESVKILNKAVLAFPNDWHFYFYRGITKLYFLKEAGQARDDFVAASKLPGAHTIVKRIAAKSVAEQQDPETAKEFLRTLLRDEPDPAARQALEDRLREIESNTLPVKGKS